MSLDHKRILKPAEKLRKLFRKMGDEPKPDQVHDLRTNARRFEALFEALALDNQGMAKSALKGLGRLRKRAGKVRDMDVLTGYASTVHLEGEEECAVRLLEHLGVSRRKHARKLHAETERARPALSKELKHTPAALDKLIGKNGNGSAENEVVAGAIATAAKFAVQLAFPPRLGQETLHPYRLKVKKLRNVLHMACFTSGNHEFVDDLDGVKDAIGEWHDWQELAAVARKVLNHGKQCRLIKELNRITGQKYDRAFGLAQALRKKYLRRSRPASPGVPGPPVWAAIATLAE